MKIEFGEPGSRRNRPIPVYSLANWRVSRMDASGIELRPGKRAIVWRIGGAACVAVAAVGLHLYLQTRPDILRMIDAHVPVSAIAVAGLGVLAVLMSASLLWNRVSFERSPDGRHLLFETFLFIPRRRKWPLESLGVIKVLVQEMVHTHSRSRGTHHLGWHWEVRIEDAQRGAPMVEVCLGIQKNRPSQSARPPKQVLTVVKWISGATHLPAVGPVFVEHRRPG